MLQIILSITFLFGVIRLITMLNFVNILIMLPFGLLGLDAKFWKVLDLIIFYSSLAFQAWYWLFKYSTI